MPSFCCNTTNTHFSCHFPLKSNDISFRCSLSFMLNSLLELHLYLPNDPLLYVGNTDFVSLGPSLVVLHSPSLFVPGYDFPEHPNITHNQHNTVYRRFVESRSQRKYVITTCNLNKWTSLLSFTFCIKFLLFCKHHRLRFQTHKVPVCLDGPILEC